MIAPLLLLSGSLAGDPIRFMVGFILVCCCIAVVIILVKWLASLAGVAVPQPLMLVLGIVLFVVLLLMLLSYSGYYRF